MHANRKNRLLYLTFSMLAIVGVCIGCLNYHRNSFRLSETIIQNKVYHAMDKADSLISENLLDSENYRFELIDHEQQIAIYIYSQDELVFWNNNLFQIELDSIIRNALWQFVHLPNAYGIYKFYRLSDENTAIAFIPIKIDYPYQNEYLINEFQSQFEIPKTAHIDANVEGGCSIQDKSGRHLFSIIQSNLPHTDRLIKQDILKWLIYLTLIYVFFNAVFLSFYYKIKPSKLWQIITKVFILLYFLFSFEIFKNLALSDNIKLYITNIHEIQLLNVWGLLLLLLMTSGLFMLLKIHHKVKRLKSNKILQNIGFDLIVSIIIIGVYWLFFHDFVVFLGIQLFVLLIFHYLWYFKFKGTLRLNAFILFTFIYGLVSVFNAYHIAALKKEKLYEEQAKYILEHGYLPTDPMVDLHLEELNKNLYQDAYLKSIIRNTVDAELINQYLQQKYLQGFWNQYHIDIRLFSKTSEEAAYYLRFLEHAGQKVQNTEFYLLPASLYDISFIGFLDIDEQSSENEAIANQRFLVLEFQPKTNFRSYSFPALLISDNSGQTDVNTMAIAKYENTSLAYSDLHYNWNQTDYLFKNFGEGFNKLRIKGRFFYVYTVGKTRIVFTENTLFSYRNLTFYTLLVIAVFLLILRVAIYLIEILLHRQTKTLNLTSKFQLVFTSLLMLSFFSIMVFSMNYIKNNYRQDQILDIEKKKHYVQKSLQDAYYWIDDMESIDLQELNLTLQELAYNFQTDINIYDNNGRLIGSSQPLIFSKHLLSDLMNPQVYFSDLEISNQYERIGKLNYLAAYTDFVNGDFLQLAYIAIPQYLSQQEIHEKLEQFLATLIQIYLIIIILSVILILFVGRRLALPLRQLENKMKLMRLDGKNEQIEYKSKDEIGKLVEQYNRTVVELEKSTELLLSAERETTWRNMARQVAHEINNPLTPMKLTLQQLQRTKGVDQEQFDEYFDKAIHTVVEQIDNLSRIAGTFSELARLPETNFSPIDIAEKLQSVIRLYKSDNENITINYHGQEKGVMACGDAEQLIQVFSNILKNACQALHSHAKGEIDVLLGDAKEQISIEFIDNGQGIPQNIQENIFKPNFTTKNKGMGLGLSISKSIVENMQGTIEFSTSETKGTKFIIYLPKLTNEC